MTNASEFQRVYDLIYKLERDRASRLAKEASRVSAVIEQLSLAGSEPLGEQPSLFEGASIYAYSCDPVDDAAPRLPHRPSLRKLADREVELLKNAVNFLDFPYHERRRDEAKEHGWLLPTLIAYETAMNGRWAAWKETHDSGICHCAPQIDFVHRPNPAIQAYLEYCLDQISPVWLDEPIVRLTAIEFFLDWLLWSFGSETQPSPPDLLLRSDDQDSLNYRIDAHERLTAVVHPYWLLCEGYDHLGDLCQRLLWRGMGSFQGECAQIIEVLAAETNVYAEMADLFLDPDVGSGRLLLEISNYYAQVAGLSIDPLLAKVSLLNCYLFIPSAVYPLMSNLPADMGSMDEGEIRSLCSIRPIRRSFFELGELPLDQSQEDSNLGPCYFPSVLSLDLAPLEEIEPLPALPEINTLWDAGEDFEPLPALPLPFDELPPWDNTPPRLPPPPPPDPLPSLGPPIPPVDQSRKPRLPGRRSDGAQ